MRCWYCDRAETEADAPFGLVAQHGEAVLACSNCGGD